MPSVRELIETQTRELPILATKEYCLGKTFIVTGANVGLGKEAVRHLVSLGSARVIMTARNMSAGQEAKANIEATTGITGVAQLWELDLASYDSVREFVTRASELDRIDSLIGNAAVAMSQHHVSEGHLTPITVNLISTFLLAVLLFPKMKNDAKRLGTTPHISFVVSGGSFNHQAAWNAVKDDPIVGLDQGKAPMDPSYGNLLTSARDAVKDDRIVGINQGRVPVQASYPLSKLMELFAVREIRSELPLAKTGVIVNAVDPGLCETELSRNAPPEFKQHILQMYEQFGRNSDHGSRNLLYAAVAGPESHGKYIASCKISVEELPDWVTNEEARKDQKRVWDVLCAELNRIEPGCISKMLA
ncbi:hypothetical protein S40288_11200 [Stachybotrys chartarum IBT 40288]|nr:hypothetical protein S40288_11200 [Stachybotrys chartarum IBT 40288]